MAVEFEYSKQDGTEFLIGRATEDNSEVVSIICRPAHGNWRRGTLLINTDARPYSGGGLTMDEVNTIIPYLQSFAKTAKLVPEGPIAEYGSYTPV
jgi:hypothetical protein